MDFKEKKIAIGLGITFVLVVAGLLWYLNNSFDEANSKGRDRACSENMKADFTGMVIDIDKNESDNFMHGRFFQVTIRTHDTLNKFVHYQFNLPEANVLLKTLHVGDSVQKNTGNDYFTLSDSLGHRADFKVEKCDW